MQQHRHHHGQGEGGGERRGIDDGLGRHALWENRISLIVDDFGEIAAATAHRSLFTAHVHPKKDVAKSKSPRLARYGNVRA
jgi:hypothetical protein